MGPLTLQAARNTSAITTYLMNKEADKYQKSSETANQSDVGGHAQSGKNNIIIHNETASHPPAPLRQPQGLLDRTLREKRVHNALRSLCEAQGIPDDLVGKYEAALNISRIPGLCGVDQEVYLVSARDIILALLACLSSHIGTKSDSFQKGFRDFDSPTDGDVGGMSEDRFDELLRVFEGLIISTENELCRVSK